MYTLYTDKIENFKCTVDVEGAALSETKVRLVLQSDKLNLLYEGDIDKSGACSIPVDKLKNILSEGETGTMRLEVIAEDTFFIPWEDDFEVKTNKRVTVEVLGSTKQPIKENKIKVSVTPKKDPVPPVNPIEENKQSVSKPLTKDHPKIISSYLQKQGVHGDNIRENAEFISKFIDKYSNKYNVSSGYDALLLEVVKNLKK